jgi:hypothetical protein
MILPGETDAGSAAGGLIEPMLSSAGGPSPALHADGGSHRTIDPHALKIPAPQGRNLH